MDARAKAVVLFRAAIDAGGESHGDAYIPVWFNNMHGSLRRLGRAAEAMTACEKVIELAPDTNRGREKVKKCEMETPGLRGIVTEDVHARSKTRFLFDVQGATRVRIRKDTGSR